ncbi:MAG TPA: deoxyribose-phosphate aldolase [Spirochaetia bacterium]|nr:deoxyribose-phosphate aldolase [Spirochaetia bacterium]
MEPSEAARLIDATCLRPEVTTASLDTLCEEAARLGFHGVCVSSSRVAHVARRLQGTDVRVCSVVGFPFGTSTRRVKAFEAREAVSDGAAEVHAVINIGLLKSKDYRGVEEDIRAVRRATRRTTILNVVIETILLTEEEKVLACELSRKAGADFLTVSTGFLGGTATEQDLSLMRRVAGKDMGLKAGGVRSLKALLSMVAAGADRVGTAAGAGILMAIADGSV